MLANGARPLRRSAHAYALARRSGCDFAELAELRQEVERLNRQLGQAREGERRRIAREMHDSTVQDLVAVGLMLRRLQDMVDAPEARKVLDDAHGTLGRTQQDLRTLSYLLHPPILEEEGLVAALKTLIRGLSSRTRVRIDLVCGTPGLRSSPEVELTLYRVVQEALINVHKHAAATCAEVRYHYETGRLVLEVEDDGIGMDCESGPAMAAGVGIQGMHARIEQLGGTLTLVSPGRGVLVRAVVPTLGTSRTFQPCEQFLLPIIARKEGLP